MPPQAPPLNNQTLVAWLIFSSFTFLIIQFLEVFYQRPSNFEQLCELLKSTIENFSFQDYQNLASLLSLRSPRPNNTLN